MTYALQAGGLEHLNWDHKSYALAAIYDAVNANTRATGQWAKGKVPKFEPFYRPKAKKKKRKSSEPRKGVLDQLYMKFAGGKRG